MRRAGLIGVLLLALLLLTACQRAPKPVTQEAETDSAPLIGMSMDSYVIERWQRDRDVFTSTAKAAGFEVLTQAAGGSLEEQKRQIRYLISRGVKAVVIIAVDCYNMQDIIEEARAAGVYVVAYDRPILDVDIDLCVSFDSRRVGELMAESLAENMPQGGKVACIHGSGKDYNVEMIRQGFDRTAQERGLNIVFQDYCDNWEAQAAYDYMQGLLDAGTQFDGVMCGNDDLASMVYKALSERAMLEGVALVGQDAELSACQRIVAGWQCMTVYKPVELMAQSAAQATVDLIRTGQAMTEERMENGRSGVPVIWLEPVAVTQDNLDNVIIGSGFHTSAEIYMND